MTFMIDSRVILMYCNFRSEDWQSFDVVLTIYLLRHLALSINQVTDAGLPVLVAGNLIILVDGLLAQGRMCIDG